MSTISRETAAHPGEGVTVSPVRTLDEFAAAIGLRYAVYVGEQRCPADEEFDGNDFAGSHILARRDRAPVGAMRLRWFSDCVKFERVCVIGEQRGRGVGRRLALYAIDYARAKGFTRAIAHAQAEREGFWTGLGFRARQGRPRFWFSDHAFVEMEKALKPARAIIGARSPAMVLNRPEGDWERAGVLDASAARGARRKAAA